MSLAHAVLAPTSSLPRLRNAIPDESTQDTIANALHNLTDIYCPLPRPAAFRNQADRLVSSVSTTTSAAASGTSTPLPVDSGYASGDDQDDDGDKHAPAATEPDHVATLRADEYERQFAIRWLTTFVACAEELLAHLDEDVRQRLLDEASYILASFSSATDAEEDDDGGAIVRQFRFAVEANSEGSPQHEGGGGDDNDNDITVRLTDGTPATGADHTDVGLQSWGASIVVSALLCAHPAKFGLSAHALGKAPRIIELGAGTGLVAITLAKLLPRLGVHDASLVATDYHPAVLANLRANIAANLSAGAGDGECDGNGDAPVVQTCLLDWAAPCLTAPPLRARAAMLVATDVVYAPEHAVWLRDCAAKLLADDGVFWLVASVRPNGRFEGVTDTVEGAFAVCDACPRADDGGGRALRILGKEMVEKQKGVGRGDEIGYRVFRIGWAPF